MVMRPRMRCNSPCSGCNCSSIACNNCRCLAIAVSTEKFAAPCHTTAWAFCIKRCASCRESATWHQRQRHGLAVVTTESSIANTNCWSSRIANNAVTRVGLYNQRAINRHANPELSASKLCPGTKLVNADSIKLPS